ncbi:MAG: biotin--[acetyl-CoA-carboxylase] ligase [Armatimonadetes bacterium]|nr:biotin--[acetyl-CoA-carboxylase] ligase [Armatimonadota bacterium]
MIPADWVVLDSVDSTQLEAFRRLDVGERPRIVFAHDQVSGKGRFDRTWHSLRGESLTMSLLVYGEEAHPAPWLIGMRVALLAASLVDCGLRWPNDLVSGGRKLGGILTQHRTGVFVIGLGMNLNQTEFPDELTTVATSVLLETGRSCDPLALAEDIASAMADIRWPTSWNELSVDWMLRDATPGKKYVQGDGSVLTAIGIGPQGELLGECGAETVSVFAADAFSEIA